MFTQTQTGIGGSQKYLTLESEVIIKYAHLFIIMFGHLVYFERMQCDLLNEISLGIPLVSWSVV